MIENIIKTNKPIILSTGMSDFKEISNTYDYIKNRIDDISILQCTTSYPTPPEKLGLNVIGDLKVKFPKCRLIF